MVWSVLVLTFKNWFFYYFTETYYSVTTLTKATGQNSVEIAE